MPNSTPGCSWEGNSQADSCAYLTGLYEAFNTSFYDGIGAGISTYHIWNQFLNFSCTTLAKDNFGLLYADYGSNGHQKNSQKPELYAKRVKTTKIWRMSHAQKVSQSVDWLNENWLRVINVSKTNSYKVNNLKIRSKTLVIYFIFKFWGLDCDLLARIRRNLRFRSVAYDL